MKRKSRARAVSLLDTATKQQTDQLRNSTATRRSSQSGRGVAKLDALAAVSRQLAKNAQYRAHGPGVARAVAVHSKFVAVGTSRGLALVFDHFQEVRQVLGTSSEDGVLTIDLSKSTDVLACGHASGRIALWDVIKGIAVKTVDDAHAAPVAALRFYSDASIVSVDHAGVVNKLAFSKATLWASYAADVECLLDGAAHVAPTLSVLPDRPDSEAVDKKDALASSAVTLAASSLATASARRSKQLRGFVAGKDDAAAFSDRPVESRKLVAFSSDKTSFVVALEPAVQVVHKWARGTAEALGSAPPKACVAWGWSANSTCVLARAWGCAFETTVCAVEGGVSRAGYGLKFSPNVNQTLRLPAPAATLAWLKFGAQSAFVLIDADFILRVVDASAGLQLDAVDLRALFCDPRDGAQINTPLHERVRASGGLMYVLGTNELATVRLQPWPARVEALVDAGEWLEALALALDSVTRSDDGASPQVAEPAEDGLVVPFGLAMPCAEPAPTADELLAVAVLRRYVRLALENAPSSSVLESEATSNRKPLDLARSHFQMLGGVCVEFCVALKRLDVLFGDIYISFQALGRSDVFLELLEPHINAKKLRRLAPEVMAAFVAHFGARGGLVAVERCLLHLEISALDFDMLISLLRRHRLYTAMFRLYSVGLDDYVSALEVLFDDAHEKASKRYFQAGEDDEDEDDSLETRVHQAILYLRYCIAGRAFPMGERLRVIRHKRLQAEVLHFLLQRNVLVRGENAGFRGAECGHLRLLMAVDARATLDALSACILGADFDAFEPPGEDSRPYDLQRASGVAVDESLRLPPVSRLCAAPMTVLNAVQDLFEAASPAAGGGDAPHDARLEGGPASSGVFHLDGCQNGQNGRWRPSDDDRCAALEYVALHFARKTFVDVPKRLRAAALRHLVKTSKDDALIDDARRVDRRLPETDEDPCCHVARFVAACDESLCDDVAELLDIAQKYNKPRAALTLHRFVAHHAVHAVLQDVRHASTVLVEKASAAFSATIARYVADVDDAVRRQVYGYCEATLRRFGPQSDKELVHESDFFALEDASPAAAVAPSLASSALVQCVLSAMPELARVDCERAAWLCATAHPQSLSRALSILAVTPSTQFGFLDALIAASSLRGAAGSKRSDGDLGDIEKASAVQRLPFFNLTDEDRALYVQLLARFAPERCYAYLSSTDGYDVETCLQICQQHTIADATAFLLEQAGDAVGALRLILSTLRDGFEDLRAAVRVQNRDGRFSLFRSDSDVADSPWKARFVDDSRRATRLVASHAAVEKMPEGLRAARCLDVGVRLCQRHSQKGGESGVWFATLDTLVAAKRSLQLAHELPSNSMLLHALLNSMVQRTLSAMAAYVALPTIVSKIIADHADSNLGEFRDIIVSMLDATRDEAHVYGAVKKLLENDANALRRTLAKAAGAGQLVVSVDAVVLGGAFAVKNDATLLVAQAKNRLHWEATSMEAKGSSAAPGRRNAWAAHRVGTLSAAQAKGSSGFVLKTAPLPQEHHSVVSTRVPGMLDSKPRFSRKLDPSVAAASRASEPLPSRFRPLKPEIDP